MIRKYYNEYTQCELWLFQSYNEDVEQKLFLYLEIAIAGSANRKLFGKPGEKLLASIK